MAEWYEQFPCPVTVCDTAGIILVMNDTAAQQFAADGGYDLIGTNALDCHPEPARTKMVEMLASGERNVYTTEKKGKKKLTYQSPLFEDGVYCGFVELGLPLPADLPHHSRD
ncbi:hypothetical protein ACFLYO_08795 [Chloroflexota bacterium]